MGNIYIYIYINGRSLKILDNFANLRSSVSSSENDINTRLAKVWIVIDSVPVI